VLASEVFIPTGQEFTVNPGQLVLGVTLEWFRFPADLMALVIGRSIWGRRGLLIVTAQAVQPLSSSPIVLEMSTLGDSSVRLVPGVDVGQLCFLKVSPAVGAEARPSRFSGEIRPVLGLYGRNRVENFLLGGRD
jgi:dCTP deaminase